MNEWRKIRERRERKMLCPREWRSMVDDFLTNDAWDCLFCTLYYINKLLYIWTGTVPVVTGIVAQLYSTNYWVRYYTGTVPGTGTTLGTAPVLSTAVLLEKSSSNTHLNPDLISSNNLLISPNLRKLRNIWKIWIICWVPRDQMIAKLVKIVNFTTSYFLLWACYLLFHIGTL